MHIMNTRRFSALSTILSFLLTVVPATSEAESTFKDMKMGVEKGGWEVIWSESYGMGDAAAMAACVYFGCAQAYLRYELDRLTERVGRQLIEEALRNKGRIIFGPGNLEIQAGDAYWSVYHRVWNPIRGRHERVTTERYVRLYVKYRRKSNGVAGTFSWSYAGPIAGKHCVQINEPSTGNDGSTHTWGDNFLCSNQNHGIRWSYAGPIAGMRCTQLHESASPHRWGDNYLCVPSSSQLRFAWSSAGPISGKQCIKVNEPADPHKWDDNYLCY